MDKDGIGKRLRAARKKNTSMSQTEFAKAVGVSRARITQIEKGGEGGFRGAEHLLAARVLGVDPWWLAFGVSEDKVPREDFLR